jgi:hypothetical protein
MNDRERRDMTRNTRLTAAPIPLDEAKKRMRKIALNSLGDPEMAHLRADKLLCEVLQSLGYGDLVAAFVNVKKWYA